MAAQFVPIELQNIERGDFLLEVDKAFSKLQRDFVAFVDEHKISATAGLNVGVEIAFRKTSVKNDALTGNYGIITKIVPILPKKPSGVTTAFVAEDSEGMRTLFTQSAGTSKENPRQGLIKTAEGKTIT